MMVVDFYTETQSPLVPDVTNKIYFQAWATDSRADVFEIYGAKLVALTGTDKFSNILENIQSEHRGKGQFSFRHLSTYTALYLDIPIANTS